MSIQVNSLDAKVGGRMVRFGDVVRNANLTERDPDGTGVERIVGLEHLDPENLHIRRWNALGNGTSFTRRFVPGQTLFGKRRAYQRKVVFAEFEGICSGDILTFEPKDPEKLLPELLPFICQTDAFFDYALGTSAGSLSPRTSWKALQDFEFSLPPVEEQKRIAEILWAADEAVERSASAEIGTEESRRVVLFDLIMDGTGTGFRGITAHSANGTLEFVWDQEPGEPDDFTVVRLENRTIWKEPTFWEGWERFNEVKAMLKEKYGTRFHSLKPTSASETYLYADDLSAPYKISFY